MRIYYLDLCFLQQWKKTTREFNNIISRRLYECKRQNARGCGQKTITRICALHSYYYRAHIKVNEVRGTWSIHGEDDA